MTVYWQWGNRVIGVDPVDLDDDLLCSSTGG